MSKLYSLYEVLKKEDNQTIYLFKSGIFYIALSDDAIFLSNKFDFKLTNLNDSVVKCGFPVSSSNKYIKIFTNNNINFKLIDSATNTAYSPHDFILNNNINELLEELKNVDINNLSVSEAYLFIENMKKKATNIENEY